MGNVSAFLVGEPASEARKAVALIKSDGRGSQVVGDL